MVDQLNISQVIGEAVYNASDGLRVDQVIAEVVYLDAPAANVGGSDIPVALFTLTLESLVIRRATSFYVDSIGNEYLPGLVWPDVKKELKDIQYGISNSESVTIKIAVGGGLSSDTSLATIAETYELRSRWGQLSYYDPITGETSGDEIDFFGKVESVEWADDYITLTLTNADDEVFDQLLPKDVVASMCHETALLSDRGKPINLPLGPCRVPCPNCKDDTVSDEYDYVVGYYGTHTPTVIYRGSKIAKSTEYTFLNGTVYPGYLVVRFARRQIDYGGNYHNIAAYVGGFGWSSAGATGIGDSRHVLDAIHTILGSPQGISDPYGVDLVSSVGLIEKLLDLEETINPDDYKYWVGINIGGSQRTARDWLNDILRYMPISLYRKYDGQWTVWVDIARSVSFFLGYNDGYYNNCVVNRKWKPAASQTKKNVKIQYNFTEYSDGKDFNYEIEHQANPDFGADSTIQLIAVNATVTAKKVMSNVCGQEIYANEWQNISCGPELKNAKAGDRVLVYTDYANGVYEDCFIHSISKNYSGKFEIDVRSYDATMFDDLTITDPADPTEDITEINGPATFVGTYTYGDASTQALELTVQEIAGYDFGTFITGITTASEVLMAFRANRPFTLPAGLKDSSLSSYTATAATAETIFDLRKGTTLAGSSSIGSATIAASGTSATFTFSSAVSFAIGDFFFLVAPATPDVTLADLSWTFIGIKDSTA